MKLIQILYKHVVAVVRGIRAVRNVEIEMDIWLIKWKNVAVLHRHNHGCRN